MTCPRCQAENDAGARFCEDCGARLEVACPSCGISVTPGKKFCRSCGATLTTESPDRFASPKSYTPKHLAEKILTSRSALEGERKQVTVLFADLKGSMELLADRDPEEARKILDPVLERMMEAVHRYEGTVNQVMGDGIMALFGAPLAHEDHAVRACYAALRMQESVKRYAQGVRREEGITVRIRVGLNSGEVVVRAIGSDLHMDYTAVGQTTHLAARLEQLADPATVLLTSATLALAEDFVQVRPQGPTPIKGLNEPVDVYELLGATPVRTRFNAHVARGLTRFVGRGSEMTHLAEALDLARGGRGQVVAVVGEPGVGKSRLFWEFAHSHRAGGSLVLESASVSYGKATTYLPVIELLRGYFQIEARDDVRRIREKVNGKLLSLDRTLEPAVPALFSLLDVPVEGEAWTRLEPAQRRQRTMDALKRLLIRESQVQPIVLVFEDLHWIDSETQAVLDALVESLPSARVLLLVNYRPEYGHGWGSKTYYRQLRVDALPAASAADLLEILLGTDPSLAPLARLLFERTEGNPLFLEESVRTLVETGVLAGAPGAYRLTRAPTSLEIPATAQAIIAARVDRLEPEDKRLLQAAAVVGKDVALGLLEAIADISESELRQRLGRLQAAEFLYEARLFPDHEYTFKHALTLEVAYGSVLQQRRGALHARIVEAMERFYPERRAEHIERLAHHAIRGEVWDKAATYLLSAALRTMERSAYREASSTLRQALEALTHLPESAEKLALGVDIHLNLAMALRALGELGQLLDLLGVARRLAESLGDRRRLGRVLATLSTTLFPLGRHEQAVAAGRQALRIGMEIGLEDDAHLQAESRRSIGAASHALGDYQQATRVLRENITLCEGRRGQEPDQFTYWAYWAAISRTWLAYCLAEQGDFAEAIECAREGVANTERVGHPYIHMIALHGLAFAHLLRGDHGVAIPLFERGLTMSRENGILLWDADFSCALGNAYMLAGRAAEAVPFMERSIQKQQMLGQEGQLAFWMTWLCEAYVHLGHQADAKRMTSQALDLARDRGQRGVQALCHRLEAERTMRGDPFDPDVPEPQYQEALTLATELGMWPLVAHCHLGLGKLSRRTGKREQAQEHLTTATTMYREMEMRFWLEQAEAELNVLR